MEQQYNYDNTTSLPTQSILQYKVDHGTVYVSTDTEQMMVNLTITVFNPTSQSVNCQNFQFGISCRFNQATNRRRRQRACGEC